DRRGERVRRWPSRAQRRRFLVIGEPRGFRQFRLSCRHQTRICWGSNESFDGGDVIASGRIQGIAFGCVTALWLFCVTAQSSALKPIDQAALQATVEATAKELLVPGAVVLLRTPQGEFAVTFGTTLLGAKISPRADTYFRAASNTKTMTAAV